MSTPPSDFPIALAREVFARLCAALPTPAIDTPEARAVRDDLAYAAVEAFFPVDAAEALLAVQAVAADAHALECLRLAGLPTASDEQAKSCRAQASSMLRASQGAIRSLRQRQAAREKAEAAMHPSAMERAGYWFRAVTPPAASPAPSEPEPGPDIAAEADQYAVIYPQRAARIRALGGLPQPCDFGPPSDALVRAIVTGTSPILRALDPAGTLQAVSPGVGQSHATTA